MNIGAAIHAVLGRDEKRAAARSERTEIEAALNAAFARAITAEKSKLPTLLHPPMLGTPMAHRVEWWSFGTVIRRASWPRFAASKAMYIGDGSAITIDSQHDVISVNPDDWVSVPETKP